MNLSCLITNPSFGRDEPPICCGKILLLEVPVICFGGALQRPRRSCRAFHAVVTSKVPRGEQRQVNLRLRWIRASHNLFIPWICEVRSLRKKPENRLR